MQNGGHPAVAVSDPSALLSRSSIELRLEWVWVTVALAENVFKNFFQEAAATGELRIPSVHAADAVPLIAGADVAAAAAGILQRFDAYAGKVRQYMPDGERSPGRTHPQGACQWRLRLAA